MHPSNNPQQPGVSNRGPQRRPKMVRLDQHLLFKARRLINGANVHRLKEMIFTYEQAVDLHNRHWPTHEVYQIQSELRLRKYVLDSQSEDLRQRTVSAVEQATQASLRSITLAEDYDRLE